jgi:Arc/MetJ-type ribon-helix-helix transcriptional regulator
MATKKYTVTLPEELAEEIREKVGPGAFSAYVTEAVQRKRENERLGELVEWMLEGQPPLTDDELAEARERRFGYERRFAERDRREREAAKAAAEQTGTAEQTETSQIADTTEIGATSDTDHQEIDYPLAS